MPRHPASRPPATPPRRPRQPLPKAVSSPRSAEPGRVAVVGAGIAGITAARTLAQAGWEVTVFEKSRGAGGRMATRRTAFGGFDHGAQFFTVRDERFRLALQATGAPIAPWNVSLVRVLDELGRHVAAAPPARETRWVATPGMSALVHAWAQPLIDGSVGQCHANARVVRLAPDPIAPARWALHLDAADDTPPIHGGFDAVLLAIPAPQAAELLHASAVAADWQARLRDEVVMAPCWTLMAAWPLAAQPGLDGLGPRWHAARSDHHRIAWVARESSKPGREPLERWVIQASPAWSAEHLEDDAERITGKLLKGFAEITGIRATPGHAVAHRWRYAQTQRALGEPYLWDSRSGLGVCGDWCLGYRVESAFLSGLALALAIAEG
ncbi:FAD-dependent oxidoreductase [Tepidimonas taiwanensis]|uniref:NAD(P)/FAD-dependent oxidoreductase n=1 Tax=Tepidimonas taiwanensis TaxID=307486 RepID=UPI0009E01566|nr:FAD-dependent oxidoreductase [Tepidimonas taiwanensis]MCX7692804.1 FAD-dependent oxidoreductase [Tepidimonas taiwanensis]UBQ04642.1 FAD-dependent oxidoreductase [Tepidimonas taiwanensis]